MPRSIGKYEIEKNLGQGTFAKVKQARNKETNELVAIKVLDKEVIQKEKMGNQVKREISIMKKISHPNIVRLYEVLASKNKIFIVLELVTGGELFDKIVKNKRLPEELARFYFQQLCVATHHCHLQGVCHRDLKPENLLLDEMENLKISDFGLSAMFDPDDGGKSLLVTMCGTPNYVAPEVISDKKKGYEGAKADTWSIGIVLFVFLAGYLPFDEQMLPTLFKKIQNAEYKIPDFISPEAKDLITKILMPEPDKRLTIPDIACHPWWKLGGPHKDISDTMQRLPSSAAADLELETAVQETEGMEPEPQPMNVGHEDVPMARRPSEYQQQQGTVPMSGVQTANVSSSGMIPENSTNAFEIINNATGGAYGAIAGVSDRTYQLFTKMLPAMALPAVVGTLQNLNGCLSCSILQTNSNIVVATFNLGRGIVKLQIHAKSGASDLYLLEMQRLGGDLTSYDRVWENMQPMVRFLNQV